MPSLRSRILTSLLVTQLTLGALIPLAANAAGSSQEEVTGLPFLTVRNKTSPNGSDPFFGKERGSLKAGVCNIEKTTLGLLSSVSEAAPFYIPEEILRVGSVALMSPEALLREFGAATADKKPLLYTHGYYIDFEKGCRRASVLREKTALNDQFLWYSWPSDGDLLNYPHDEADLYWSVPELVRTILKLEDQFGAGRVNLAGHSLGGRGMVVALNDVAARQPDIQLGELVLLAPDMDFGIFQQMLPQIRPIVKGITLYVSDADRPLAVSASFHGYPRLGETGNDVASLKGVNVINLSDLPTRSPTGHLYHVYNDEVGADLDQLLNDGQQADMRSNLVRTGENTWSLQPAQ
ncbi:MAG: alpha/beta hydrolase [Pseudoruegeria sp.]